MKKRIVYLFIYLFLSANLYAQNQINGYDFVFNLKNDVNYGQIDFYKKDADPCSTTNEKSLYAINATVINSNQRAFLNFKVQVTDCMGKIYEQTISLQLSRLQEGFTENYTEWALQGTLTTPPYKISTSSYQDNTRPLLVGQLKPTDPDSIVIKTRKINFGKKIDLEIIGGDDYTNSQTSYWSWKIGTLNAQETKTKNKKFSIIAEANTTVYVTAVSMGPNNNIVSSKTISKNIIVDTKSYAPTVINATNPLLCSNSIDGTTLSLNDGILGKNASWVWYKNGCGDQGAEFIESGKDKIKVIPNTTTTYYVRAESSEGPQFNTNCTSITVNVVDPPNKPTISINDNPRASIQICEDQNVVLKLDNQLNLNKDNSHWEWYSKTSSSPRLDNGNSGKELNEIGNSLNFEAKETGFYYAISKGGVCKSVTSESAYVEVKSKTKTLINIDKQRIGTSRKYLLTAPSVPLGDGSKYIWYTGSTANETDIANLQPYGEGSSVKIKSRPSEYRYVFLSGKGECDNPQVINGSTTISQYYPIQSKLSQYILNFGSGYNEDPSIATSSYMFGQTFKEGNGYYFKYVSTDESKLETNGLVVNRTSQLISNYPTDGSYYKYISDAKTYNAKSYIVGGILTDKKQFLNLYYGVGYGEVKNVWGFNKYNMTTNNFMNIGYAKNEEKSFGGLATDLGVILRIWYFNINGGITAIFGSAPKDPNSQSSSSTSTTSDTQTYISGHVGIGFSILSRK